MRYTSSGAVEISSYLHLDKQYRAITGVEYKSPSSGTSGQSSSSGKSKLGGSDITWWNGTNWVVGDGSDEHQKWYAYCNGW